MCAGAIIQQGFAGLVFGARDPEKRWASSHCTEYWVI
jgi:tRNA(Arg) A34 adenosine deaminase TadA